jgi:SAM-dependent methyltransferase
MSTYVFDQASERERERLRGLELLYDEATTRFLAALGVTDGWRCLEVGCGAGTIALWLADRVGPTGRVVATDLDPRFLDGHGRDNLDVRTHDISDGAPEAASFDLVHARAVVEHVPDRDTALANILASVRPGGWALIEDVDFGGPMPAALARYTSSPEHGPLIERLYRAGDTVLGMVGADASFGAQLVGRLHAAGFEDVGGEIHAGIVSGGTEQWTRGTVEHLREPLMRTGVLSGDDVEGLLALTADRTAHYATAPIASVWGRRPTR